ncbi:MAG: O-methyltransferase [bacterium]|nr:O-methyltransferase [bacterium]
MLDQWTAVDNYFNDLFIPSDPILDHALHTSDEAALPQIAVSPVQGKLLYLLAQIHGAKNILEIGTLGGYSTIWMARALPVGGKIVTLEANFKHAEVAKQNIAHAGFADMVDIRVGYASDTLPTLTDLAPFDLIFIDADKPNTPLYLEWSLKLAQKGTVIIADNVVRRGEIINPKSEDENVIGMQRTSEAVGKNPRLSATVVQTVGSKGYDGFILMRVVD